MSDARWLEIDTAIAAAVRHFGGAGAIFARLLAPQPPEERYLTEMAFMHAMQAGQTSLEAGLLRILDLFKEEAPTGPRWHADLIARIRRPVGGRPPVLADQAARAADETRRFRTVAAHTYDQFDHMQAVKAVEAAALLVTLLPREISKFRAAVDP